MAWIDRQFPRGKQTKAERKAYRLQNAVCRWGHKKYNKLVDKWNASPRASNGDLMVSIYVIRDLQICERKMRSLRIKEKKAFDRHFREIERFRYRWAKANNRPDLIEAQAAVSGALKLIAGKPADISVDTIVERLTEIVSVDACQESEEYITDAVPR